jgi:hypothetical protein
MEQTNPQSWLAIRESRTEGKDSCHYYSKLKLIMMRLWTRTVFW